MEYAISSAAVVLDCGSSHARAGFGGEKGPRLDVPCLVGYPRHRGLAMAAGMNEQEVGEEALLKQGSLDVHHPIRDGFIEDWGDVEKLWSHLFFNELRVSPETHSFLLTEPVNTPAAQRERTLEIMMETFRTHALYLGTAQVLSLYSYGLTTGLVVDCGKDMARAVPVHEGYALGRHVTQSPVAGEALTRYLGALLRSQGYALGTATEQALLNTAKEALCYVRPSKFPLDAPTSASSKPPATEEEEVADFVLPDGQRIPLVSERHQTAEVLFNYSLLSEVESGGTDKTLYEPISKVRTDMGEIFVPSFEKGISWLPFAAVNNCEPALQPQLYANTVLAGASLSFPGVQNRMAAEMRQLYRTSHPSEAVAPIRIRDVGCRAYSTWIGGSMLAQTSVFEHLVVSRAEYEEEGARVIHYKSL